MVHASLDFVDVSLYTVLVIPGTYSVLRQILFITTWNSVVTSKLSIVLTVLPQLLSVVW